MPNRSIEVLGDNAQIDVAAAIPLFAQAWHKTVSALFEMLELIQQHQNRPGFERLCEALDREGIIKRSVMSMLQKVIANPVLMSPEHRELMPPSYNTLWTLTALKEDVLETKIASKELTPFLTLETARQWKSELKERDRSSPRQKAKSTPSYVYATLLVEDDALVMKNSSVIERCLDQLRGCGLHVALVQD